MFSKYVDFTPLKQKLLPTKLSQKNYKMLHMMKKMRKYGH